jgi:hypothetical protein
VIPNLSIDRTHTTTVRLDLRDSHGYTTFGVLKAFVVEAEARGAADASMVVVAHIGGPNMAANALPIVGVCIDHLRGQFAPAAADAGTPEEGGGDAPTVA